MSGKSKTPKTNPTGVETIHFDVQLLTHLIRGSNHKAKSMLNENLVNAHDAFGTLLHYAAWHGNAQMVQHLIDLGSEIDFAGQDGKTSLMLAVLAGHTAAMNVLLEANADIDIVNTAGRSALQIAFKRYHCDSDIAELFARKLQTETLTNKELARRLIAADGNMYHAATLGDVDLAECMLQHGINIDSRGPDGRTALQVAGELNHSTLAKWLINHGADVNARGSCGRNALLSFAENRDKEILTMLLEKGCDPNFRGRRYNDTPLFALFALETYGDITDIVECTKLLLRHGATVENSAAPFSSIFDVALSCWPKGDIVKLLISHLAMQEVRGASITRPIVYCNKRENQFRQLEFENFHNRCLQVLKIVFFEKMSLFDLLELSEMRRRVLVRRGSFISTVDRVYHEHQLNILYPYYYGTLTKSIIQDSRVLKLEDKTIAVICKISKGKLCYYSARKVVEYLGERDIRQLVRV